MNSGRKPTTDFFKNLKNIVEKELRENPHQRFSYYSLSRHIAQLYQPVGSYGIQQRVSKLVEEGKCTVITDPRNKNRKQIIWNGNHD